LDVEANRLLDASEAAGIPMRLLGGVAVRLRCPSATHRTLRRSSGDIDLCAHQRDVNRIGRFFETMGYEPWLPFNQLNAEHSQRFQHRELALSIDVFLDRLTMCHTLDLRARVELEPRTLTQADQLLSKQQIVQLNEKDIQDIVAIVRDHPIGTSAIDLDRIVDVCGNDWGWHRTARGTLARCANVLDRFLDASEAEAVATSLARIAEAIDEAPKSRKWKLRARIGERKTWYELPEDPTRKA
jgi:hypothetical protein